MPDIKFWDNKLTEEVEIIQILVSSRDDINTSNEDDQQIDKLIRDAFRTRRCFEAQVKLSNQEDQEYYLPRFKLLDRQLTALEFNWVIAERSHQSDSAELIDDVQERDSFKEDEDSVVRAFDAFEEVTVTSFDDSSLNNSLVEVLEPEGEGEREHHHARPKLVRTTGAIRLDRTDGLRLQVEDTTTSSTTTHRSQTILKRIRRGLHLRR